MRDLFRHFTSVSPRRDGAASRTGIRAWRALTVLLPGLVALFTVVRPTWGLGGLTCISDDNHVYFVLRGNVSSKGTEVTSVAITSGSAATCIESPPSDGVLTAFAAGSQAVGAASALLPNRVRTTVINGKANASISCSDFDPSANGGTGLLVMPGGGTVAVAGGTIPLVDVHTGDADVPAAVDLLSEVRTVNPFVCAGATMAFPLPNPQQSGCTGSGTAHVTESSAATGEQDCQTVTFDDTNESIVGNIAGGTISHTAGTHLQTIPDGFLLQGTCSGDADCQTIVFVASQDSAPGFGVAAAGYKITASNEVFGTDSFSTNDSFNDTPTPLVTPTPTPTPMRTPVPSPSVSHGGLVLIAGLMTVLGVGLLSRRVRSHG